MLEVKQEPEAEVKCEITHSKITDLIIEKFGGPMQFIQQELGMPRAEGEFQTWLIQEMPPTGDVDYIDPSAARAGDELLWASPWAFGYDCGATTKPPPYAITCKQLAAEMEKDGFVTNDEPLRAFARNIDGKSAFVLGHVKGAARFCVLLAPLVWLWKQKNGMKVVDVFPLLYQTARRIRVVIESHATLTSIALRNATLSQRGSIRKAHDAVTWVGKLLLLKGNGQDPSQVLKTYNNQASSSAQINGGKRVSVLALMSVDDKSLQIILDCVSKLGFEQSPWPDDAWANKKIMPGYQPRLVSNEIWSKRLAITEESFLLMVHWQRNSHMLKLPQLRRKLDKTSMEEASQLAAMVLSLAREMCSLFPIPQEKLDELFVTPFATGRDATLLVALQSLLHEKPTNPVNELFPLFEELVVEHTKTSDVSLTGVAKTELIQQDIDKSEYELFEKKLVADIDARGIYVRKSRMWRVQQIMGGGQGLRGGT